MAPESSRIFAGINFLLSLFCRCLSALAVASSITSDSEVSSGANSWARDMVTSIPIMLKGTVGAVVDVGCGSGVKATSNGFLLGLLGQIPGGSTSNLVEGSIYSPSARMHWNDWAIELRIMSCAHFLLLTWQLKTCDAYGSILSPHQHIGSCASWGIFRMSLLRRANEKMSLWRRWLRLLRDMETSGNEVWELRTLGSRRRCSGWFSIMSW